MEALWFVLAGADLSTTPFEVVRWGLIKNDVVLAFIKAREAFIDLNMLVEKAWPAEKCAKVDCGWRRGHFCC